MPARAAQVRGVDAQYYPRRLLGRSGPVYDHVRINSANRKACTPDDMQTICIWEVQTTSANESTCRRLSGATNIMRLSGPIAWSLHESAATVPLPDFSVFSTGGMGGDIAACEEIPIYPRWVRYSCLRDQSRSTEWYSEQACNSGGHPALLMEPLRRLLHYLNVCAHIGRHPGTIRRACEMSS